MYIPPKKQKEIIQKVKTLTRQFKKQWDKIYTGTFRQYRKMSNGELPDTLVDELALKKRKYDSKLVPRVIPVANEYLKTSITNALWNSDQLFEFVGRNRDDHSRAEKGQKIVMYQLDATDAEETIEMMIEDAIEVGGGFGEIVHHEEKVLSPGYVEDEDGEEYFNDENEETIYEGAKLQYVRPEMLYFSNDRNIKDLTAYAKIGSVPISKYKNSSLYNEYAANIKKIEAGDYDANAEETYDTQDDHASDPGDLETPDFKVLSNEFWVRMSFNKKEKPTWYLAEVANWEHGNAQLIRFERDPMRTGKHPLIMVRIYPKNNRLYGECVPERIQNYMLEMFHKRNQRINLVNLAHDLGGMLLTNQGVIKKDHILAKRGKILTIPGDPKNIKDIKLDLSPLNSSMQEEALISKDIQEQVGYNPVSLGGAPSRRETATTTATVDENARARANRPIRAVENTLIKPLAKGFLLHAQLFMPDPLKLRILGKDGMYGFESISKADILGFFDVKCKASTELLPKSMKLSLYNVIAQQYLGSGVVRMKKQEFARDHFQLAEIRNVNKILEGETDEELNAMRENNALLSGIVPAWQVLEHEDHEAHRSIHNEGISQGQQDGLDTTALERHDQEHAQMMLILNGQVNVGKEAPNPSDIGAVMTNQSSGMLRGAH